MNTIRSVGYGWVVLIIAGGGSYYFAKRSVNADRTERAEAEEKRRQLRERMRVQEELSRRSSRVTGTGEGATTGLSNAKRRDNIVLRTGNDNPSPSQQAEGGDPAPVTHEQEEMARKGRYEAAEPFRSRKGDRFS
ncbi:hypothetical protein BAUCODRAFT_150335 [Baudoinia panamericana UAMH 10762]|uniref:Uncharacterized protein n=1 Tax=Baudoinia panamericana (strain UAMH 10762) TaxID=717646 RepID=M2MRM6_BAUPA|nr:uncharacterized protein BAUCODRAFT_150335 [Baudoinia panamericana UAMH 10762]EMC94128.1 hypothetical protein BAUCODRAFT_150335 [Baudoinia panamericana UAMH 10762]